MMKNPYALGFSAAIFLYVAVESAIYVWMPTLLASYHGRLPGSRPTQSRSSSCFAQPGRFVGSWMLAPLELGRGPDASLAWQSCSASVASMVGGIGIAVFLLPLSGLFMSVLYPTINSKGISCFRKPEHGAVAGVILFFTCLSAVAGATRHGRHQRRFRRSKRRIHSRHGFCGCSLHWIASQLDFQSYATTSAETRRHRIPSCSHLGQKSEAAPFVASLDFVLGARSHCQN